MRLVFIAAFLFLVGYQAEARGTTPTQTSSYVLPATDRQWSGADYEQASEALASIKGPLPSFSDERGSELLHRITSLENFSLGRDQRIPIKVRITDYASLYKGTSSILLLYYSASLETKQNLNAEMASLAAFTLHASALGVGLVDEVIATMGKETDPKTVMEGVRKMYSGLTTVFVGAEKMLTEPNGFSDKDRSTVLLAMAETLPTIKKALSPKYLAELRGRLELDKKQFTTESDLRQIDLMLNTIST